MQSFPLSILNAIVGTGPSMDSSASPRAVDSYILAEDTVGCSDHCPVVLVLAL